MAKEEYNLGNRFSNLMDELQSEVEKIKPRKVSKAKVKTISRNTNKSVSAVKIDSKQLADFGVFLLGVASLVREFKDGSRKG